MLPTSILPTSSCFKICCMKPTISISTVSAGCVIDTHHPLLYSAHLHCSTDSQSQGKAQRFAGQVQHWAFMALIPSERIPRSSCVPTFGDNWRKVCELLPLRPLNSTDLTSLTGLYELHSFKQDRMVPKMCYN